MFRHSMTGNPALAMFEAMLMIFACLLAEAGAKIGHVPGWRARPRHWFPQAVTRLVRRVAREDRCRGFVDRRNAPPHRAVPPIQRRRLSMCNPRQE